MAIHHLPPPPLRVTDAPKGANDKPQELETGTQDRGRSDETPGLRDLFRANVLIENLRAARIHYSAEQHTLLFTFPTADMTAWCFGYFADKQP